MWGGERGGLNMLNNLSRKVSDQAGIEIGWRLIGQVSTQSSLADTQHKLVTSFRYNGYYGLIISVSYRKHEYFLISVGSFSFISSLVYKMKVPISYDTYHNFNALYQKSISPLGPVL